MQLARFFALERWEKQVSFTEDEFAISKIIRLAEKDIEDLNQIIPNCNKEMLNSIIEEILNREDLFESKKTEFEKKLKKFREKYNV